MEIKKIIVIYFFINVFSFSLCAKTFTYDDKTVDIEKTDSGKWDYNHVIISYKNGNNFSGQVDDKLNLIKGDFYYKNSGSRYTGTFNSNGQPEGERKKSIS